MSLDRLCIFKKMADKYPELHPDKHNKYIFLAAECFDCGGHRQTCKHYLPMKTENINVTAKYQEQKKAASF